MNENEGQKQEQAEPQQQQQGAAPHKIEVIVTSSGEVTGQKQALGGLFSWWKYNYLRTEGKPDQMRRQVAILLHSMGGLIQPSVLSVFGTAYFEEHEQAVFDALIQEVGDVEKALVGVRKQMEMMVANNTESTNGASSAG